MLFEDLRGVDIEDMRIKRIDHLVLVAGAIHELGIIDQIGMLIPCKHELLTGQGVQITGTTLTSFLGGWPSVVPVFTFRVKICRYN